jgi:hypothetical protein
MTLSMMVECYAECHLCRVCRECRKLALSAKCRYAVCRFAECRGAPDSGYEALGFKLNFYFSVSEKFFFKNFSKENSQQDPPHKTFSG